MTSPRVLIVEDEAAIADNIVYALRTEGFDPQWLRTGHEALEQLSSDPPDLVILDIGLPDMSGFDVCRAIRQQAAVPVIFLTARDSEIDKVLGLELGGDDYMVKPFSPRELTARVRARLRRHQVPQVAEGAEQQGFELNEAQECVLLNGEALELTRYEFKLLAMLIAQPKRVFSREQLLEKVWTDPGAVFDRTVDTHIKTLRQKIRQRDPNLNPIRTHRGSGYSWSPS